MTWNWEEQHMMGVDVSEKTAPFGKKRPMTVVPDVFFPLLSVPNNEYHNVDCTIRMGCGVWVVDHSRFA